MIQYNTTTADGLGMIYSALVGLLLFTVCAVVASVMSL